MSITKGEFVLFAEELKSNVEFKRLLLLCFVVVELAAMFVEFMDLLLWALFPPLFW